MNGVLVFLTIEKPWSELKRFLFMYNEETIPPLHRMIYRMSMYGLKFDVSTELSKHITQNVNIGNFTKSVLARQMIRLTTNIDGMITTNVGKYKY